MPRLEDPFFAGVTSRVPHQDLTAAREKLRPRRTGLRSAALSGAAGAEDWRIGPGGAAGGMGIATVFCRTAAVAGSAAEQGRPSRVCTGAAVTGDLPVGRGRASD